MTTAVTAPIHLLICEDSDDDAVLIVTRLRRDGIEATYERVQTAEAAEAVLRQRPPDAVISDYNMPAFHAEDALRLLHDSGLDVPFILVSGQIGEEPAAALMRAGAHDFVLKDRLTRLAPAVQRELREADGRRQHRQAEAALRESEQRFRLFAEHAPDIIFRHRVHPQPEVEYLSPATAVITGHRPDELCGHPDRVFSAVEPADRASLEASWQSPTPDPLIVRWLRPDGTTVWTEQRAVAIRDEDGELVAVEGILRDITDQVAAQQERERLELELRQTERLDAIGQLAGGVAHDFNNLLGVILGHTELALAAIPPDHPARADLEGIRHAAQRGAALTRQLLIFSRLEPSQPETLDLNTVVTDTERLLRRTIGEDIDFVTLLDPDLRPVTIDRSKLEQILLNLVVNSRAAMPDGGRLTIETTNTDPATGTNTQMRPHVRLTVTDTGCGMPPDVARRAFEPFFTTKGPGKGTGLGLATTYGAVKEAGGEITLTSQPGKGTTIRVQLPAAEHAAAAAAPPAAEPPGGRNETILVVEDEQAVREIITRILSRAGYRVIEAPSPAEVMQILDTANLHLDAVLTDVVMPGMSGTQLAEHIRHTHPTVPILFMSGYAAGSPPNAAPLPVHAPLIRKPFDSPTLLRHLRDALEHATAWMEQHGAEHTPLPERPPAAGAPP
jgi:two-component system cell cycle sensor histidine kinase/response regulator CckA